MGQMSEEMAQRIIDHFYSTKKHYSLTAWEVCQLAHGWLEWQLSGGTKKEAWWSGYRAGKGLPHDTTRQDALAHSTDSGAGRDGEPVAWWVTGGITTKTANAPNGHVFGSHEAAEEWRLKSFNPGNCRTEALFTHPPEAVRDAGEIADSIIKAPCGTEGSTIGDRILCEITWPALRPYLVTAIDTAIAGAAGEGD